MSLTNKHLRLAVIGAPSSGKTYLLSDLIQALSIMGFEQKPLPLSATYSSFGAFFAEMSGANGHTLQTERYACRQGNHYGAIFSHPDQRFTTIEVDFLNLPGEVFREARRLSMFVNLRNRIANITNPVFVIDTYANPAGRERYVLRHATTDIAPDGTAREMSRELRHLVYMDRQQLYAELRNDGYTLMPKRAKRVNGRTVMQRFFDIVPDSFVDTLYTAWALLFPDLDIMPFKVQNVILYFYPLMYCAGATDLIVCDKLFRPGTNADTDDDATTATATTAQGTDDYDFGSLLANVGQFVEKLTDHHPNAYLAFRGADFMLLKCEETYSNLCQTRRCEHPIAMRNNLYSRFVAALHTLLYGPSLTSTNISTSEAIDHPKHYADPTAGDPKGTRHTMLSGMNLATHLTTRFGQDIGKGFWQLLLQTTPRHKADNIRKIYNAAGRPKMPPHVFFTATPIDENFCIYRNDPDDVSRFVSESPTRKRAFHIVTTSHEAESMCWGSLQLLDDILTRNGIPSPAKSYTTDILDYFKGVFQA